MPEALRLLPRATLAETVRPSFPILQRRINGNRLVYCDSAATSLTPDEVLDAEAHYYRTIGGNVHRGSHALALEASEAYEGARAQVARFVGARSEEIVFTPNATGALNIVAAGLTVRDDEEVVACSNDHHSALLPFLSRGSLRLFDAPPDRPLDPQEVLAQLGTRTRLLVLSHASNVTGVVQPVHEICRLARARGVSTLIDASQSAPHLPLDVRSIDCDFLAFSGHKLLGPTGIGVLYGRSEALRTLRPRDIGGGTVARVSRGHFEFHAAPTCLEPGTPNIAGALGLAAATRFLERLGWPALEQHHRALARAAWSGLATLPELRFLSSEENAQLPTVSMVFPDLPIGVDVVSAALSDRYGVMVRSGLHCAHPLFEQLGLRDGALRASFYLYNTVDEVAFFCASLTEILTVFR